VAYKKPLKVGLYLGRYRAESESTRTVVAAPIYTAATAAPLFSPHEGRRTLTVALQRGAAAFLILDYGQSLAPLPLPRSIGSKKRQFPVKTGQLLGRKGSFLGRRNN